MNLGKRKNSFFPYMCMNGTWVKRFFISHISGWVIAMLQTLWIVWEIRRSFRALVDKAN